MARYLILCHIAIVCCSVRGSLAAAQEVPPAAVKNSGNRAAGAETRNEFEIAKSLQQKLLDARNAFQVNQSVKTAAAMESVYAEIAKAQVHTEEGNEALTDAYRIWAMRTGLPKSSWEYTFEKLAVWRKLKPDSATAEIATGRAYVAYAWDARGAGLAGTVGEENFKLFHERIAEARKHLLAAEKKKGVDPVLYQMLIDVCKAEGCPRAETFGWLKKSRKLAPNFAPSYMAVAEILMPRWGGKEGELEEYSRDILEKLEGEGGQIVHAKVTGRLLTFGHLEFFSLEGTRPRVHAGAKLLAKRFPKSVWCQTVAAVVGLEFQDRDLCKQTLQVVKSSQPLPMWGSQARYQEYLEFCGPDSRPSEGVVLASVTPLWASSIVFLQKGTQVAVLGGRPYRSIQVWDVEKRQQVGAYPLDTVNSRVLTATPDGDKLFAVYFRDQSEDVIKVITVGKESQTLAHPDTRSIRAVSTSSDGKYLATIDGDRGDQVTVWDIKAGKILQRLAHASSQDALEFSSDGKLLACVQASVATVWDWENSKKVLSVVPLKEKLGEYEYANLMGFLGKDELAFLISSAGKHKFVAYKFADKSLTDICEIPTPQLSHFRMHPEKGLVAALYRPDTDKDIEGAVVQLWDLRNGKFIGETPIRKIDNNNQIAFSPDGTRLGVCSNMGGGFEIYEIAGLKVNGAAARP